MSPTVRIDFDDLWRRPQALTSLQGVDAEIIEFVVHKKNYITKKPLRDLHLPNTALIGGVIRGDRSLTPDEDFQLQVNDKVIVFALPEAISCAIVAQSRTPSFT